MNLNQIKKLMERKKNSQKGENGNALIIGGSNDLTTAPAIAGLSALRAGCDLVTIAAPEKVAWAINQISLDLITHKVPGTNLNIKNAKELGRLSDRYDAVLLGNGLTKNSEKFCQTFLKKSQIIKIIDGEALRALSFKEFKDTIVTPNEDELKVMLSNSNKEFLLPKLESSNAKEKAEVLQGNLRYFLHNNNILVLKGATDIIISRNKIAFNRTGNQGMTKNSTGDILSGLILGFLVKTKEMFKSAVAASYINGHFGDLLLKKKKGYSFIASDILNDLTELEAKINKMNKPSPVKKKKIKTVKKKKTSTKKKSPIKKKKVSKKKIRKKKK